MLQLALLGMAACLVVGGVRALRGLETTKRKTHPGVAVGMLVLAGALVVLAVVALPLWL